MLFVPTWEIRSGLSVQHSFRIAGYQVPQFGGHGGAVGTQQIGQYLLVFIRLKQRFFDDGARSLTTGRFEVQATAGYLNKVGAPGNREWAGAIQTQDNGAFHGQCLLVSHPQDARVRPPRQMR